VKNQDRKGTVSPEYSQHLGGLSHDQFQAALDRFDLGELVSAQPIPFGNFGQNVFLTSTKGDYVLRGKPHYPWQFPKENLLTQLLYEHTPVPVPWPYLLDLSNDIFGWSYVIMQRMPGLQLIDPDVRRMLTAADKSGIANAMGMTLAHMQTLVWPYAGEYDLETNTIQPLGTSHGEWIISRIKHHLQLAIPLSDRTTSADVQWVEQLIAQAQEALAVPFTPCFVMQDYKEANAVAEHKRGTWCISGIFDYMEAYFGDGEIDLCRQVAIYADENMDLAQAFVSAYMQQMQEYNRPSRPGFAKRFPVYMLLDRLIIWRFGQRHGVWWDPRLTL